MHPFRIAILIFVVGASIANYFAAREHWDRIVASTPLAASTAAPTDSSGTDWTKYRGTAQAHPNEQPTPELASPLAEANDKAWMREAIIVTIAGVAWFLLPGKNSKQGS
jgi:hypothetical protein